MSKSLVKQYVSVIWQVTKGAKRSQSKPVVTMPEGLCWKYKEQSVSTTIWWWNGDKLS